jgi:hypothetical protein
MAIRKNRGVIFGTQGGMTQGQQMMRTQNPNHVQGNTATQFGRSTSTVKPVFGGRTLGMRRR